MIQTETIWTDSGYDCDHCGGKILIRTDKEKGVPDKRYYQCEACACQWTLKGDVLRVGHLSNCQQAQHQRDALQQDGPLVSPVYIVLGLAVLMALLIFFGGLVAIRFLIPIVIVLVVVGAFYWLGRERMWW